MTYVENSFGDFIGNVWYKDNNIPLGHIINDMEQNEVEKKIFYDPYKKRVYYIKAVPNPEYDPKSENFTCNSPQKLENIWYFNLDNYEIGNDGYVKGTKIDEIYPGEVMLIDDGKYIYYSDGEGYLKVYDTDNNFNSYDISIKSEELPYNYTTFEMKMLT